MTRYSVVDNDTGEIMLETDSQHLQAADRLLRETKHRSSVSRPPYGHVKTSTYKKRQTIGQAAESWWQSAKAGGQSLLVIVALVALCAVVLG